MNVYSIGRDPACNIVINDNTDVVSRRHAILNVYPSGKMTIVDQSHNGTYVNGIRISQNVPVPVTRKDNVSLAHVARLDWNLVPNPRSKILQYLLFGLLALLLVIGGVFGYRSCSNNGKEPSKENTPAVVDSASIKQKAEELKKEEERKQDSIKKHIEDSIKKANSKPAPVRSSDKKKQAPAKKDVKSKGTTKPEPKKTDVKKDKPENTPKWGRG